MTQLSEKEVPEILVEEDSPPVSKKGEVHSSLPKEKGADNPLDLRKFSLGFATLGWCIFLMVVCIILSIRWPDNELVKSGFEAFKLIVMTILGYIFGSNSSKSN